MLSAFFIPISTTNITLEKNNFFNLTFNDAEPLIGLKGPGVALVGCKSPLTDAVRNSLRILHSQFRNIQLYDFGYPKDESPENINNILTFCGQSGIIPVFIGENFGTVNDSRNRNDSIIISNDLKQMTSSSNIIGYQRHLCTLENVFQAEEFKYNTISLGKMRSNPSILEPALRHTSELFVHLKALRSSDASNIISTYPTGLYAEELCQILKHAGTGSRIKAVFFEAQLKSDIGNQEAEIVAEAVWYFAEGINNRVADHPDISSDYTQFIIHSLSLDEDLEFLKHNQTTKWWLKHPFRVTPPQYLACSYEEYHDTINDDIPDRIFKFINNES
ncbi:MAG: hypothetical protein WBP08_03735 [Saprospiraceae bacterium]|jgi:hypothetical protein|nr:hypothetical protein [Saprospiraceae bacterium]